MDAHKRFEKRVRKSLDHVDTNISLMRESIKGLQGAFQKLNEDFN